MALFLDVGPEDALRVGESWITVERKSGSRARLRIMSNAEVELIRNAKRLPQVQFGPNPPSPEDGS